MKPVLNRVCLILIDCYNYGGAVASLKRCMEQCEFAEVKFLTDIPLKIDGVQVIQIPTINSKEGYSEFCIKELYKYFDTDFVLVVQHDGWILNGNEWLDEFMEYDLIAPPWLYQDQKNVGCGGFSLRSKKLQTILGTDDFIFSSDPEDQAIGRLYRDYLIKRHDIKFAPEDLADRFGFELRVPIFKTFGFHGKFHTPYQPTIIIQRMASLGDVVQVEKLMEYYHDNGYRVVLNTLPQFALLFVNHYFKVNAVREIDSRIAATAKILNLDMSYESVPKQLHLKTYFEYAGVSEKDYLPYLKRPTLKAGFEVAPQNKLFKKYVVIHIDRREQKHRNIYEVDWERVVDYLKSLGYTPIQIGKDDGCLIKNAIKINCTNEHFLAYVVGCADMMIGNDSGPSHIASGFDVPSIIFFGSVNPAFIHPDLSQIEVITNHEEEIPCCPLRYCWHESVTNVGQDCIVDKADPPCVHFKTERILEAIKKLSTPEKVN